MRDKVSIARVAALHPKIKDEVAALIDKAETHLPPHVAIRIVQGLRTIAEQNDLYNLGRTVKNPDGFSTRKPLGNIVTNAKGGSSYHNYGLAIDFALLIDKDRNGTYEFLSWDLKDDQDKDKVADWMEVVKVFTTAGYEWGGNWVSLKDNPHFQKTFGYSWRELYKKYTGKEFITTPYVKL